MQIRPRLFLDTEVFIGSSFNFNTRNLLIVKQLASAHAIELVITDIVIEEVIKHMKLKADDLSNTVKRLEKNLRMIYSDEEIKDLNGPKYSSESFFERLKSNFYAFLDICNTTTVYTDNVNSSEVFDLYFKGESPFSSKGKKSEFPDAFTLLALRDYSIENFCSISIVTTDADPEKFCDESKELNYFKTLDEFISKESTSITDNFEYYNNLISIYWDVISDYIIEDIGYECGYEPDSSSYDIIQVECQSVDYVSHTIISIIEPRITLSLEVEASFSVDYEYFSNPFEHPTFGSKDGIKSNIKLNIEFEIGKDEIIEIIDPIDYLPVSIIRLSMR